MSPEAQAAYEELKQYHEDLQVTQIQEWTFIWRPLTRLEYRNVRKMGFHPGTEEELFCSLCVLWPENYDWQNPVKAGHPTSVCNDILTYSGFLSWEETQKKLQEYEHELQYFDAFMDPVICAAFPSIRPEEPQTWTMSHALWVYSRAKWLLERLHGFNIEVTPGDGVPAPSQGAASAAPATGYVETPADGFAPESETWLDEVFFGEDDEEIPDIPGFPKVR